MKTIMLSACLAALLGVPNALAAERCNAAVETRWTAAGASIEAFASGATCEKATSVIVIRNAEGVPQLWDAAPTEQNMLLAGKTSAADLEAALKELVDQTNPQFKTTGDLPEWAEGAEAPVSGEFPFYVEDGIDRENYIRIRAAKAPIFCYVQGMESLGCVYKQPTDGYITRIGAQSFPG